MTPLWFLGVLLLLFTNPPCVLAARGVSLSAVEQLGLTRTALVEGRDQGEEGMRRVMQVVLRRAELSGETVMQVMSLRDQFVGFYAPWRASDQEIVDTLDLAWEVYASGDYGKYTHFWPVYVNDSRGRRTKNKLPTWWRGEAVRHGGHYFGTMPFSTTSRAGMRTALRRLAEECEALAEWIFPQQIKVIVAAR
jgi:hypothetical protein